MPDTVEAALPRRGTVLAFDYGLTRTGLAQGDLELRLAVPLTTLALARRARFLRRHRCARRRVAAGAPRRRPPRRSTRHEHGRRCERFCPRLHGRHRLPVVLVDEAFSSCVAERQLVEVGHRDWRHRKPVRDALAACAILQSYFDGAPWRDAVAPKEPV